MNIRGPFRNIKYITLASSSPRRQRLLASLGIYFDVVPSGIEEDKYDPDKSFEDFSLNNAIKKAEVVVTNIRKGVVISADTIVVIDKKVIGKPKDENDALNTLKLLSGRIHRVITGCCFWDIDEGRKEIFTVESEVKIASFPDFVLAGYVNTKEVLDKAGSYAVQGVGAFLVEWIRGSYTNVVGFPLKETVDTLLKLGAIKVEE